MTKTGKTGNIGSMSSATITGVKPPGRPRARPTSAPTTSLRPQARPAAPTTSLRPKARPDIRTSTLDPAGSRSVAEINSIAENALRNAENEERRRRIRQVRDRLVEEATRAPAGRNTQEEGPVPGRAFVVAFRNWLRGEGPTNPGEVVREARRNYAKGGMVSKESKK